MLVYQNKTAKDVFYGDSKIKQIYLGNRLIYNTGFMNFLQFNDNCILCVDRQLYRYSHTDVNSSVVTAIKLNGVTSDYIVGRDSSEAFDCIDSGVVSTFSAGGSFSGNWDGKWDKILASQIFMRGSDIYNCPFDGIIVTANPELILSGATFVNTNRDHDLATAIVQTNSKVYEVDSSGVKERAGIDPGLDWLISIHVPLDADSYFRCFLASRSGTLVLYRGRPDDSGTSVVYYEHWRSSDGVDYSKMQLSFMPESYITSIYGLLDGKVIKIKLNEDFSCTVSTLLNNCTRLEAPYAICNGKVQFFSTDIEYTPIYPPDPDANYIDVAKDGYTFVYRTADGRFFHVGLNNSGGVFELSLR